VKRIGFKKILSQDANIKLNSVVSNISGAVYTKLIDALIEGKEDLEKFIYSIYHKKLKVSKADLLKAVTKELLTMIGLLYCNLKSILST
jgi:transposase